MGNTGGGGGNYQPTFSSGGGGGYQPNVHDLSKPFTPKKSTFSKKEQEAAEEKEKEKEDPSKKEFSVLWMLGEDQKISKRLSENIYFDKIQDQKEGLRN